MHENELATIIIGEAIYVHKQLGPGLLESPYEECLVLRLGKAGLTVERQKPMPLVFDSIKLECGFRCDIMVNSKVIVEVKAVEQLGEMNVAQVLTYLKMTDKRLGLLMNFNVLKLKDGIKRVVNGLWD